MILKKETMKNLYFSKFLSKFSISRFPLDHSKLTGLISVKRYQQLVPYFIRSLYTIGGRPTRNRAKVCFNFAKKVWTIKVSHGMVGLISYLKTCYVITQQSMGGYRISDVQKVGFRLSRTKSGFPRIIPVHDRKLLRAGDSRTLKFWLTLFSFYRVLIMPGKLKLSTITSPFNGSDYSYMTNHIDRFIKLFLKGKSLIDTYRLRVDPFVIRTASPNSLRVKAELPSHPSSVYRSFKGLLNNKEILDSIISILKFGQNDNMVLSLIHKLSGSSKYIKYIFDIPHNMEKVHIGQLAAKQEPAGKVRLFAMVDAITQWTLKPLHNFLFSVLRSWKDIDGTFNQTGPLSRVPFGKRPIYSFDLSAATDRLPVGLQESLIRAFSSLEFARSWKTCLVNRSWKTPDQSQLDDLNIIYPKPYPGFVKYAIGQPMGAYSSWAMLALTHHYILQTCAWNAGVTSRNTIFKEYAVLGDDIVIWNKRVAELYLKYLKDLGVEVGLSKSLVSPKGVALEFAKRTLFKGIDCSPIPFKDMSSAHRRLSLLINFTSKNDMSLLEALRFLGYGYKVDPNKINNRVVRAIHLAQILPRNYLELISIYDMSVKLAPMKLIEIPNKGIRKLFISTRLISLKNLIFKESINTLYSLMIKDQQIIRKWNKLLIQKLTALECSCLFPSHNNVRNHILFQTQSFELEKGLSNVLEIKSLLRLSLDHISGIRDEVNDNLFPIDPSDYLGLLRNKYQHDIKLSLRMYIQSRQLMDSIMIDGLLNPRFEPSTTLTFYEEKRTLQLWNQWSTVLSKSKISMQTIRSILLTNRNIKKNVLL
jgi:hypothetical protein